MYFAAATSSGARAQRALVSSIATSYYKLRKQTSNHLHVGTGEYNKHKEKGAYKCAGCGEVLYTSETKFDSGCGWPAFYDGGLILRSLQTAHSS